MLIKHHLHSTVVNDTPVENRIGDALVKRIIRAHRQGTKWKACIVIPLLPGFPYPIDHGDASAVSVSMRNSLFKSTHHYVSFRSESSSNVKIGRYVGVRTRSSRGYGRRVLT